jgi:hypothetical protein
MELVKDPGSIRVKSQSARLSRVLSMPMRDEQVSLHPSIAAIRVAFPPAAVVSMQVTRSVANRAT